MSGMTPARERFVEEFLVDMDPVAAALRAGYDKCNVRRDARRIMACPEVRRAITEAKKERACRLRVTQDRVVQELAAIGFASMADVCRWSGDSLELLDSALLTTEQAAAIAEITETTTSRGGTVRVKLHSKLKALEMLARHVGLYEERMHGAEEDGHLKDAIPPALRERLDAVYAAMVPPLRGAEPDGGAPEGGASGGGAPGGEVSGGGGDC